MRLVHLEVSGFRGFGSTQSFDLDSDVVLVHGPNGTGKTSMFDAILWAITGNVSRIGTARDLISKYSDFGEASVRLVLRDEVGSPVELVRRVQVDGKSSLTASFDGSQLTSGVAEAALIERLWPDGAASTDPTASLSRSLTRAVYLQQDQVRQFIEGDGEQGRFEVIGELVGAGRLGELIRQLETGRRGWTTATNRLRDDELAPLVRRRDQLGAARESARASSDRRDPSADTRRRAWMASIAQLQLEGLAPSAVHQAEAGSLGPVLEALDALAVRSESELRYLERVVEIATTVPPPVQGLERVRSSLAEAERTVSQRETELRAANDRAADERRRLVAAREASESLAALARLALRHVDGDCPVCGQSHDIVNTISRLNDMIAAAGQTVADPSAGVPEAAEALAAAQESRSRLEAEQRELQRLGAERNSRLAELARAGSQFSDGQMAPQDVARRAQNRAATLRELVARASELRREGEALSAVLAREVESTRLARLDDEFQAVDAELLEVQREIERREAAGEDAKLTHEAVRALSERVVVDELEFIEPLLQRVYASVDPHPSFRAVRFLADTYRGRGRLKPGLVDAERQLSSVDPRVVLSSSQLNVLAVVTFLTMNLSVPSIPVAVLALDDPLQSLDNLNLLGLTDLLRRSRSTRQLVLSTHDDRLSNLLERKLRPVGDGQRTTVMEFSGWEPRGPTVHQREVARDDGRPRLRSVG